MDYRCDCGVDAHKSRMSIKALVIALLNNSVLVLGHECLDSMPNLSRSVAAISRDEYSEYI